jgi:polyisoprenoid-binding protein YceI
MKGVVIFILLFVYRQSFAQNIFMCKNGEISFFSESPVENIDATSKSMNSVLNTSTSEIAFVVPMTSFTFKKALMQEHFNEKYVESDKFPYGAYKGTINEKIDYTKDGEYDITSKGTLTIHGVAKERTDKGKLTVKNGAISIKSEFKVAIKDHDIKIPKLVMSNIADTINVNFAATYSQFKKDK